MDYKIFKLLARWNCSITPPSSFAGPKKFKETANYLWRVLQSPAFNDLWAKDQGLYRKCVTAARYCEDRSNR